MAKPHAVLRGALIAMDIDESYLARKLCRGTCYISQRMMGRKPWPLDECYKILDMLREPYARLPEFFPPAGRAS